jgi:hypothetical protein
MLVCSFVIRTLAGGLAFDVHQSYEQEQYPQKDRTERCHREPERIRDKYRSIGVSTLFDERMVYCQNRTPRTESTASATENQHNDERESVNHGNC